jgi:hypothetical protein
MESHDMLDTRREAGELELLEPEADAALPAVRLERRLDGQIWGVRGCDERPVRACRCFPWSEPTRFISLRDQDDAEVALVRDAHELDPASRKVLEEALAEAGFVLEVCEILAIDEEIEIRSWKVRTRQGARSFQTPRDEWPRDVPGGGLIVRDVAGDLYHIARAEDLDPRSQRLLWALVD